MPVEFEATHLTPHYPPSYGTIAPTTALTLPYPHVPRQAGFPFGGITSFGAFSHHIPKPGGSAVVVYAPHVGVDATGVVGKVDRRGMPTSGACCGSACAALNFCKEQFEKEQAEQFTPQVDFLDAQQAWVGQALLPNAKEVVEAPNPMAELPRALFKAQKEAIHKIITAAAPGNVPENTPMIVVGGIQINTPTGTPDFFLPLQCGELPTAGPCHVALLCPAPPRSALPRPALLRSPRLDLIISPPHHVPPSELRSPAGELQVDLLAELTDPDDAKWTTPPERPDTAETISG